MVCGPVAVQRGVELAQRVGAPAGMARVVVAIDGPGGAGKSTLAARVAASLGGAPVIHTDDFASWDNPLDWWPRLIDQVLVPLSHGQVACYQRFDWDAQRLADWCEVAPGRFLIIEGVSAFRREFRPYLAAGIWVRTDRRECLRRGLERDGQQALDDWLRWQRAEDSYVARHDPERAADLVVSGENGEPWPGPRRPDKSTRSPLAGAATPTGR